MQKGDKVNKGEVSLLKLIAIEKNLKARKEG
jgi:hypothetical protein